MLVSRRCRTSFLRFIHPRQSSLQCRRASSSSLPPAREDEDEDEDDEGEDVTKLQRRQVTARPEDWLDGEGLRYKDPKLGTNWLGGDVVCTRSHWCCATASTIPHFAAFPDESFILSSASHYERLKDEDAPRTPIRSAEE